MDVTIQRKIDIAMFYRQEIRNDFLLFPYLKTGKRKLQAILENREKI